MRTLNVVLEDKEYFLLEKAKKNSKRTWREFLVTLSKEESIKSKVTTKTN